MIDAWLEFLEVVRAATLARTQILKCAHDVHVPAPARASTRVHARAAEPAFAHVHANNDEKSSLIHFGAQRSAALHKLEQCLSYVLPSRLLALSPPFLPSRRFLALALIGAPLPSRRPLINLPSGMHTPTHACAHARTHPPAYPRTHARTFRHTHTQAHTRRHTHTHTHTHTHKGQACVIAERNVYTHTHTRKCTHTYAHAHAHHTHTHTHIHTYTHMARGRPVLLTSFLLYFGAFQVHYI